jgi:nucleotide-binding universal stress UspA family protein
VQSLNIHTLSLSLLIPTEQTSSSGRQNRIHVLGKLRIEREEERAATEALQEALTACREAGVPYMTRSERGAVAATIDRVAREEHVAQIIMGTRGLGGVGGLLLGSVATQLLHVADVPVTLVM